MALIEIEDVHFTYSGRKKETLQGVSFTVRKGETVLLLGASGSGKSTLALCLNGLIPHADLGTFQGDVRIAGAETALAPMAALSQQVGMVFQDPDAQTVMQTVEEEVAFGLENLCVPAQTMEERITAALAQMGLLASRHAPVSSLSGGNKQRLALACALAMRPHILVFDEPTANLDPVGTHDVFATIHDLKQTGLYTILLIEHKLDDILELIDRVIVLSSGGKVLLDGTPHAVFTEQTELLLEHGIWIPQVALAAHRLHTSGWKLASFPITRSEALTAWKQVQSPPPAYEPAPVIAPTTRSCEPTRESEGNNVAIEIAHLSFQVGKQNILKDISLSVPQGDFLALVGPNGAGKTTLAYHLADIVHPPRHTVFLNGEDITRFSPGRLLQEVGYVFQNPEHQFVANSVQEELRFGLRRLHLPEEEVKDRVARTLEQFGLSRYARAHPFTLSHGEKRRLSVATMVLNEQQVLILDEPTFGQDQRNATALLQLLQTLNQAGQTICIITHDMSLVAEYASHVAVLIQGKLRYHGPTAPLFAQTELLQEAHLRLPPIAQLAHDLAITEENPGWKEVFTLDQFVERAAMLTKRHN